MPLTYPVAVANIMSRPRMPHFKVVHDVEKVGRAWQGGLIGWSEISHPDYAAAVADLDGYSTYHPEGTDVPISWWTERFRVIDVGVDFGNRSSLPIAPARHTTWGLWHDLRTDDVVGMLNPHMIPGGWSPKKVLRRVFRRMLWNAHQKRILTRLAWLQQRAARVHVTGDINRPALYTFTGVRRSSGPGVMYLGSTGAVAQAEPAAVPLNSDHDAQVVEMTPRIVPPPPPPPKEPPVPATMPLWLPGAIHKPIPQTATDPTIIPVGDIFHIAVSEADSLHDYFADKSGGIESTGYIRRDGTIEQYRPLNVECDAQGDGNSWIGKDGKRYGFNSWETQGMGDGEWTAEQLATIKQIIAFKHAHGTPLRVCPDWNQPGSGYHRLFARWNKNGHSCPGDARVRQWNNEIVPWMNRGGTEEDDDVTPDDITAIAEKAADLMVEKLLARKIDVPAKDGRPATQISVEQALRQASNAPSVVRRQTADEGDAS